VTVPVVPKECSAETQGPTPLLYVTCMATITQSRFLAMLDIRPPCRVLLFSFHHNPPGQYGVGKVILQARERRTEGIRIRTGSQVQPAYVKVGIFAFEQKDHHDPKKADSKIFSEG